MWRNLQTIFDVGRFRHIFVAAFSEYMNFNANWMIELSDKNYWLFDRSLNFKNLWMLQTKVDGSVDGYLTKETLIGK